LENAEQKLLKGGHLTSFWKSFTLLFLELWKKLMTNQDKCFLLWYPNSKHVFLIFIFLSLNYVSYLYNILKRGHGNTVMCLHNVKEKAFV